MQRHHIDVQEYCTRYLKNSGSGNASNTSTASFTPVPADKGPAVVKRITQPRSAPPVASAAPVLSEPALAEPDLLGRIFSDDLEAMALVVCRFCQLTMAPRKLLRHIRTDHGIDSKVYLYRCVIF